MAETTNQIVIPCSQCPHGNCPDCPVAEPADEVELLASRRRRYRKLIGSICLVLGGLLLLGVASEPVRQSIWPPGQLLLIAVLLIGLGLAMLWSSRRRQ